MKTTTTGPTGHKRVLRWGNAYGIRLTTSDLKTLGLHEDDEVSVTLEPVPPGIDWDAIPVLRLGPRIPKDVSVQHDEIAYQGWLKEQHEKREAG